MEYLLAKQFARELRKNQTDSEKIVWQLVRNRKFEDYKFTRQFVIEYKLESSVAKYFIVDFYCHEKKLILEIDGDYHKYQLRFDKNREAILKAYGFKIIRFANEEVEAEIDVVKAKLKEKLKSIPI